MVASRSSMPQSLTIILRLPDAALSPNARCHWRKKAEWTKAYRSLAYYTTRSVQNKPTNWPRATVEIRWFHKTMRFPDRDNSLASLKSAFDGLTDAGVWVDDSGVVFQPIVFEKDATNPRVELTITPA